MMMLIMRMFVCLNLFVIYEGLKLKGTYGFHYTAADKKRDQTITDWYLASIGNDFF